RLAATIGHGNLVVMGTETWGNARVDVSPQVDAEYALDAGFGYVEGRSASDLILREPRLEVVPVAPLQHQEGDAFVGAVGSGYEHRLVWSFVFQRPPDDARWEVVVDAHRGEVLSLEDTNKYAQ